MTFTKKIRYRIVPSLFSRYCLEKKKWYGWSYVTFSDSRSYLEETVQECRGTLDN